MRRSGLKTRNCDLSAVLDASSSVYWIWENLYQARKVGRRRLFTSELTGFFLLEVGQSRFLAPAEFRNNVQMIGGVISLYLIEPGCGVAADWG